jgi:hypothetical protein
VKKAHTQQKFEKQKQPCAARQTEDLKTIKMIKLNRISRLKLEPVVVKS